MWFMAFNEKFVHWLTFIIVNKNNAIPSHFQNIFRFQFKIIIQCLIFLFESKVLPFDVKFLLGTFDCTF